MLSKGDVFKIIASGSIQYSFYNGSRYLNVVHAGFQFENRLLLVPLTGLVNSPFSFSKIGLDFGGLRQG